MLPAFLFLHQTPPIQTPYARQVSQVLTPALAIPSGRQWRVTEGTVGVQVDFDNPFDPEDVALDLMVTPPSGEPYTVPMFFYAPYSRELAGGKEEVKPAGEPEWRYRWTPMVAGTHQVSYRLKRGALVRTVAPVPVEVAPADTSGFVRVSEKDRRFFATDDGKAFWPLGANLGWGGDRGTYSYDDWIPRYTAVGANWGRVWLSPAWATFGLEQKGRAREGKGLGQFDLGAAWKLDQVLDLAGRSGMRLQLCIDSYNILRDRDAANYWEQTPHNVDNGGPLRIWSDFWVSERMDRLYRMKLRYLVARYGAYPQVFGWEFWNEVDLTRDYDAARGQAWHQRMARALRELDPYDHPMTTSASNTAGLRGLDGLPEMDYIQSHHYSSPDLAGTVAYQQARKVSLGKPHFFGEIGADWSGGRADDDPNGLQIQDPLWVSAATGAAGGAMPWWWDNYIHPRDLYRVWKPVGDFVRDVDWPAEGFRQVTPTFAHARPTAPTFDDVSFAGGPTSWEPSPLNRPRTVVIGPTGAVAGAPELSGILHGVRNHPKLTNPVTFQVNLPRPTRLRVVVSGVSGYGGAALRLRVDGQTQANKVFADPDGDRDPATLQQYNGTYAVTVPAGRHTVVVDNPGADWLMASYHWEGLRKRTTPPLQGWAVVGERHALAWVRRAGRTWAAVIVEKRNLSPAPDSVMGLRGLASGPWGVEIWDTASGEVVRRSEVTVGADGRVRVSLPPTPKDWGVKLTARG